MSNAFSSLFGLAWLLMVLPRLAAAQETVETIPVQPLASAPEVPASSERAAAVELEAVTVTGSRMARREGEGAESVRVIPRREIEQSNARDLYDLMRRVANLSVNEGNSAQRGGFTIRGIVDTGPGSDGIGSRASLASVYVDGAALSTQGISGGPVDAWDLAQIEVFRGPQSTTQGRNALAGAIVLRSQDPTPFHELRAKLQGGELRSSQTAAALGGPVPGLEDLSLRGSFNRAQDAGASFNETRRRDDWDREDARRGRAKLLYTPGFLPGAKLLYTHVDSRLLQGDGVVNRERAAGGERVSESSEEEFTRNRSRVDSVEVELPAFTHGRFVSVTALAPTTRYQQYDFNRSARPGDGLIRFDNIDRSTSQELRYQHRQGAWKWVLGGYGGRLRQDLAIAIRDAVVTIEPTTVTEIVLDADILSNQVQKNAALFGEADWRFAPRWTLTAGGRYDKEHLDFDYSGVYTVPRGSSGGLPLPGAVLEPLVDQSGALPPDTTRSGSTSFDVLLPKLGLTWDFIARQSLALNAQQGYRSGGVSINPVRGTLMDFDPEFTDNLDLAWRAEWLGRRLKSRTQLFYVNWRDQQVDVALSANPLDTQTENAGRSRLYGGELELRFKAMRGLELIAGAGYTRTKFIDFTSSSGSNFEGKEFPQAARYQGLLGFAWQSANGYFVDADVSALAGSFRRPDNKPGERNEGRNLVNARLGWTSPLLTVFLAARNLTDSYYVTSKAGNGAVVGEPRVVSGGLELRWR